MADQIPVPAHIQQRLDQELAHLDELVEQVRRHRHEECVIAASPCVGHETLNHLAGLSWGQLFGLAGLGLARLADQSQPTTIEGISL